MNLQQRDEVINRYYDEIYKLAFSLTRNRDIADEITQDVFFDFIKKSKKLENVNIYAWLAKSVKIHILRYYSAKKRKYEKEIPLADLSTLPTVISPESNEILEEDFDQTVNKILQILTEKEKALFVKLYIENKEVDLIAKETGLKKNNIYVVKNRIKSKVKAIAAELSLLTVILLLH